jgi:uncharacterized membrane protein
MSDDNAPQQTLVGLSFDDPFRAREFVTAISRLASRKELVLEDVVIVAKTPEGRTIVEETTDPPPGRAALSGAMWAGLFGLFLGGPVGWLAGSAIGAGVGAATAKVVDHGIPDEWVAWFREAVAEGTTTVAILAHDISMQALIDEAHRFTGAELVYANLDPFASGRLRTALGQVALEEPSDSLPSSFPPPNPGDAPVGS